MILPAAIVQLYCGITFGFPPTTFAVNVIASPSSKDEGQETLIVGHGFCCQGSEYSLVVSKLTAVPLKAANKENAQAPEKERRVFIS
jgi:hypothetical protein